MYLVESFPVGLFQCNCSIVVHAETKKAMVVDPGDDFEKIVERLEYHEASLALIWHTHAHIDHIGATKTLYDVYAQKNMEQNIPPPTIYLHEGDRWLYENVGIQADMLGLRGFEVSSTWQSILDGQRYDDFPKFRAAHTPGHTPGSCCLFAGDVSDWTGPRGLGSRPMEAGLKKFLFTGDTLFRRSIGRTDLWGGNHEQLLRSIRGKLFSAGEGTVVIPGHGLITTLEEEKEKNPFLVGTA